MKVAFLGAGRMGSTILKMMQRAKIPMTAEVCEPDEKVRGALAKELKGVKLVVKAEELGEPEVVLLAVKPKTLKETGWWGSSRGSPRATSFTTTATTWWTATARRRAHTWRRMRRETHWLCGSPPLS